jgi:hypothetical protein
MILNRRLGGVAGGMVITLYGLAMLRRGAFAYHNSYSMTLYSPGVVAIGILICFLSVLPVRWVNWLIRRNSKTRSRALGNSYSDEDDEDKSGKRLELS